MSVLSKIFLSLTLLSGLFAAPIVGAEEASMEGGDEAIESTALGNEEAPEEEKLLLEFYYGAECPHCHEEMDWFPELQEEFPSLEIVQYEVWHDSANLEQLKKRLEPLGEEYRAVPTNIIGDKVVVGFDAGAIRTTLGELTHTQVEVDPVWWEKYLEKSWPITAMVLGAVDGFNPCAMWSLIILLGFLLSMENKKRRWLIGGIFLASSGILYGAALLTYLFGFSQISSMLSGGAMTWVFRIVGVMAIASAIASFYAFWQNKVECEIRDPGERQKFHKKLTEIMKKEELLLILPGVIVLAFSVNAIELLCSFAIPTTFTANLVSLDLPLSSQLTAIAIYDFFYMLDDIIVFLVAMFFFSITTFSGKIVRYSHLIGGIVLLLLGILMLIDLELFTKIFS